MVLCCYVDVQCTLVASILLPPALRPRPTSPHALIHCRLLFPVVVAEGALAASLDLRIGNDSLLAAATILLLVKQLNINILSGLELDKEVPLWWGGGRRGGRGGGGGVRKCPTSAHIEPTVPRLWHLQRRGSHLARINCANYDSLTGSWKILGEFPGSTITSDWFIERTKVKRG